MGMDHDCKHKYEYGNDVWGMTVETTGPQGGDAGYGGKTTVSLDLTNGMYFEVNGKEALSSIKITGFGDWEGEALGATMLEAGLFLIRHYQGAGYLGDMSERLTLAKDVADTLKILLDQDKQYYNSLGENNEETK